jgi:ribonucleoside-diphosphate reductase alpha chain
MAPEHGLAAANLDAPPHGAAATAAQTVAWQDPLAQARAMARAQGFEGEACGECGHMTMVRNGTCLKCTTCGSTSGCS